MAKNSKHQVDLSNKLNVVLHSFIIYFLYVTFTDAPRYSGNDGSVKTTLVVVASMFDDTVHPSPCPIRSTIIFTLPFTRVGCEAVTVKSVSFSLYK